MSDILFSVGPGQGPNCMQRLSAGTKMPKLVGQELMFEYLQDV